MTTETRLEILEKVQKHLHSADNHLESAQAWLEQDLPEIGNGNPLTKKMWESMSEEERDEAIGCYWLTRRVPAYKNYQGIAERWFELAQTFDHVEEFKGAKE